jgi:hypothetical protein
MSHFLQNRGGLRVVSDDWNELAETMLQMAEGYAVTDPPQGYLYRGEANQFAALPAPASEDELSLREIEAEAIKRSWTERLRRNK